MSYVVMYSVTIGYGDNELMGEDIGKINWTNPTATFDNAVIPRNH